MEKLKTKEKCNQFSQEIKEINYFNNITNSENCFKNINFKQVED